MKKILLFLVLGFSCYMRLHAAPNREGDTLRIGYQEYLGIVLENHPLAKQAALRGESGKQYVRVARGAFDPYLAANWDAKQFAGKNYWQIFEGSMRVPTGLGTEFYSGWTSATGYNLNPSQNVPNGGQAVLGVEVNLGRGLLIDQRRADLQKAKIYAQATIIDQRIMLLDLINDATNAYWNWWLANVNRNTYMDALSLAQIRFEGVRSSYLSGENPAIDTLEAFLLVQTRQLNISEAQVEMIKTERNLNNYLWSPAGEAVAFSKPISPAAIVVDKISLPNFEDETIDSLIENHPDMLYYQFQEEQLVVEEKWRREQLKPELSLKYQALTVAPVNTDIIGGFNPANNYKWGVKFSFPLLLRKQRGYLELTRISIQDIGLQQARKELELRNKIAGLLGQLAQTEKQIQLFQEMVSNYFRLVTAETQRFDLGESSIFLVNSREQKLIESELKLNELLSKLPKLLGETNRITGGYLIAQ